MILLICGVVLLLTSTAFIVYEYVTYRETARRELETLGKITASNISSSIAFKDQNDATEVLQALKAEKTIELACAFDKEGNLLATYPDNIANDRFPKTLQPDGYRIENNYLEGYQTVIQKNTPVGTIYLKANLKGVYSRFFLYGAIAFAFVFVSLLFAFLLSRRLQGTIINPILQLAEKARLVSDERDYSVRAEKKSNDELGVLTDAFNHMLTQIEAQNREIVSLNESLEEKIALRTGELQDANAILKEQNDLIETIIDSSVDLIAVFDKNLHFLLLNKQADHIYHRDRGQLVGRHILEVFPQLEGSSFIINLQKAFHGELVHQETYVSIVSGRHFENFFIPLTDHSKMVNRVMVIGHDITSIRQAQEKLKQLNTELEKSNQDLEQFAYVASHDLQEPLRKIKTFSELSEKNMEHPEILKRYLQKISSSAARMTDLIKAVLNYSRLSKVDSEMVDVDLNETIRQIMTDLELSIEERKAVIDVDKLPIVKGIPLQMSQLFLNLTTNALKFSERDPHITIRASKVTHREMAVVAPKTTTDFVKITFADNGIGFNQAYADKVFSIFQRLHSADKYSGTGIGLALCKKIVENHGGHIFAESHVGEGTTFFIYLPIQESIIQPQSAEIEQLNSTT